MLAAGLPVRTPPLACPWAGLGCPGVPTSWSGAGIDAFPSAHLAGDRRRGPTRSHARREPATWSMSAARSRRIAITARPGGPLLRGEGMLTDGTPTPLQSGDAGVIPRDLATCSRRETRRGRARGFSPALDAPDTVPDSLTPFRAPVGFAHGIENTRRKHATTSANPGGGGGNDAGANRPRGRYGHRRGSRSVRHLAHPETWGRHTRSAPRRAPKGLPMGLRPTTASVCPGRGPPQPEGLRGAIDSAAK
jgi:hypothetical protein